MNFSRYLGFNHLSGTWRRIALFFITLFAVISLQHFISQPILATSSSFSNAIASSSLVTQNRDRLISQSSTPDFSNPNITYDSLTEEQKALANKIFLFAGTFGLVLYVFTSFCMMKIADKLDIPNSWLAWIPIAQLWVMVRCAGKPGWWLILLLVPLVNIVIALIILFETPTRLGKSSLFGLLAFIPILGVFLYYGLLAFT